jgi:hypothetical protein
LARDIASLGETPMSDRLNPEIIRRAIDALRVTHPEIAADEEAWLLALESETDTIECFDRIVDEISDAEDRADSIARRIERIKERRQRFVRRGEAMRSLAFKLMQHINLPKLVLDEATLSIRNGPRKVIITDETALPDNCWRIKREPALDQIRKLINSGETVNGAELSNAEPVLSVHTK